jgi:capsular polysaccharide biosynthesis protein
VKREKQSHGGELLRPEKGESGNPNGAPRKLTSKIISDLKEAGVEAVTPGQVSDAISVLLNLTQDDLKRLAEDKDAPILVRRTARRLVVASDREWDKVISDNLDRAHGKAKSSVDVTTDGESLNNNPLLKLSADKQAEVLRLMQDADK